jgi:hypothetical protein
MLDAPVDAWYVWVGLALVAATAVSTVSQLHTTPPPDAQAAAGTVDRVAAAGHAATGRHHLDADAVKVEPDSISLRDDGRTSRAALASRITPVRRGTALWRVLRGARPPTAFDDPDDLRAVARMERTEPAHWRSADELYVRAVTWEGVDVTLVGA